MKEILLSDLLSPALSRTSDVPLQRQIYDSIRRGVLDRHLLAGQKLPSSRALAVDLDVSRITVSLAYDRLIAEGYLTAAAGKGTFVAMGVGMGVGVGVGMGTNAAQSDQEPPAKQTMLSLRGKAINAQSGGLANHSGAFVPGVADASLFPFHIWRRLLSSYLKKSHIALAGYAQEGAGYLPLREAIAGYLRVSRSVDCTAEQVIVTAGTNQSIDLCARLLTDHGDTALIENPCHWAFPSIFLAAGLKIAPAPLDHEGLALNESHFNTRTRLVVSSPSHQYPTGAVMSLQRRQALLKIAHEHDSWIIEDDYDSEFRYDGPPIPSLQGMDHDGRVIYMGTFSKAMFAGIRVSYLVVPQHVANAFSSACAQIYRPGQLHLQAALADFIGEGHLSQHIRRLRREYGERQTVLRDAIKKQFGTAWTMSPARAGLHLLARPSGAFPTDKLVVEAAREGLVLRQPRFISSLDCESGDESSTDRIDNPLRDALVLGYGGVPTNQIERGVALLAKAAERVTLKAA